MKDAFKTASELKKKTVEKTNLVQDNKVKCDPVLCKESQEQ